MNCPVKPPEALTNCIDKPGGTPGSGTKFTVALFMMPSVPLMSTKSIAVGLSSICRVEPDAKVWFPTKWIVPMLFPGDSVPPIVEFLDMVPVPAIVVFGPAKKSPPPPRVPLTVISCEVPPVVTVMGPVAVKVEPLLTARVLFVKEAAPPTVALLPATKMTLPLVSEKLVDAFSCPPVKDKSEEVELKVVLLRTPPVGIVIEEFCTATAPNVEFPVMMTPLVLFARKASQELVPPRVIPLGPKIFRVPRLE